MSAFGAGAPGGNAVDHAAYAPAASALEPGRSGADGHFPQPVRLTREASGYLDAARALAALAVLLGHWRALFFVEFESVRAVSPLVKALYAVSGFGRQAVMVFFVLSGFFISSSVFRKLGRSAWSWTDYAVDRGARLYVVLIPGLLLGLLWDSLGVRFLNNGGVYSHPLSAFGERIPANALAPSVLLGNLLFLQTRFTPEFGSNAPLWSLFNEFWYYALFPALLTLFLVLRRRAFRAAAGPLLLAVVSGWILGAQLSGFVVWMAGCGVALSARHLRFSDRARWLPWLYTGAAGTAFGLCLWRARAIAPTGLGSDLAVGLSCALLMHGILQLRLSVPVAGLALAKACAGFSFSLYVLHFPLLLLIRAAWLPALRWQPDLRHAVYGAFICAGVLLYAYAIARVTEANTAAVRAWIRSRSLVPGPGVQMNEIQTQDPSCN